MANTGTRTMTREAASALALALTALKVTARVIATDEAPTNPDGSYTGEVITRIRVDASIADKTGNLVARSLYEGDPARIVREMTRELRTRTATTKAAIRTEKARS